MLFLLCLALIGLLLVNCGSAPSANNPAQSGRSIQNKGSDTLVNLALAWAERYMSEHPDVHISVTGGGSGTGIAALLNHTVDIANASRAMTPQEIDQARKAGIDPVTHVVAKDAIGVIVNPHNPVNQLTLQQVSDIYTGKIANWKEVGGEDRPIVLLSRESNSGTHVYFLEQVVRLGQPKNAALFSPDTLLLPSSEGITAEVRDNPNAIGYDGLGYLTSDVKKIAVSAGPGKPYVLPTVDTARTGNYPISRDLYMITDSHPAPAIVAYLAWISGVEAQQIVGQLGFVPLK